MKDPITTFCIILLFLRFYVVLFFCFVKRWKYFAFPNVQRHLLSLDVWKGNIPPPLNKTQLGFTKKKQTKQYKTKKEGILQQTMIRPFLK